MADAMTLQVLTGANAGQTLAVSERGASLGRSKMADLQLEDGLLSRLHCSFSFAEGKAYVQDLNSSNGTRLNGEELDDKPHRLMTGDVVTVGDTALRVELTLSAAAPEPPSSPAPTPPTPPSPEELLKVPASPTPPASPEDLLKSPLFSAEPPSPPSAEAPVPEAVDLGLGEKQEGGEKKKVSPIRGLIAALAAILVLLVGAVVVMQVMETPEAPKPIKKLADDSQQPFEFAYERLKIDNDTLYRYTLTYAASGALSLSITDLGGADRSFSEAQQLNTQAQEDLRKLLINAKYTSIPEMYALQSSDGTLERKQLAIVYGAQVWTRTAENDPDATSFHALCDELEAFAKLKLGVIATQYSAEELTALAQDKLRLGQTAWEERDLSPDKLHAAVRAYMEGLQLLRTLNPKPAFAAELTAGLAEAESLLAERYDQANFGVQKALQTKQYREAQANLQAILRMIPDREDQRNIDATRELLRVESMMKNRRP